jgi:maltose O-acetyltransferase
MESRPCYGEEYTLRQAISQEKKTQMFNDLKDGVGFVI